MFCLKWGTRAVGLVILFWYMLFILRLDKDKEHPFLNVIKAQEHVSNDDFVMSIISRVESGEDVFESDSEVQQLRLLLESRRRSNISYIVSCIDTKIERFNQFYASMLLQTVLPQEILIALSPGDETHAELPPILWLLPIPKISVYIRSTQEAFSNRVFLMSQAEGALYSHFGCDDFMHPQRTEYLDSVFDNNPNVDALLHGYISPHSKHLEKLYRHRYYSEYFYSQPEISTWINKWQPQELRSRCSVNSPCNINTMKFLNDNPLLPTARYTFALGWLSFRKQVLQDIQYPNHEQDPNLYFTTDIIRSNNHTLAAIDEPLGLCKSVVAEL